MIRPSQADVIVLNFFKVFTFNYKHHKHKKVETHSNNSVVVVQSFSPV